MPFALIVIGLLIAISAINGTTSQLGKQLAADFTGSGNFTYWIMAIGVVGFIGYIPSLQKPSRMFLALVIIAMVLANGGVFQKLQAALQSGPATVSPTGTSTATTATNTATASLNTAATSLSNIGSSLATGAKAIGTLATFGSLF